MHDGKPHIAQMVEGIATQMIAGKSDGHWVQEMLQKLNYRPYTAYVLEENQSSQQDAARAMPQPMRGGHPE